jgi:hypothetical protein
MSSSQRRTEVQNDSNKVDKPNPRLPSQKNPSVKSPRAKRQKGESGRSKGETVADNTGTANRKSTHASTHTTASKHNSTNSTGPEGGGTGAISGISGTNPLASATSSSVTSEYATSHNSQRGKLRFKNEEGSASGRNGGGSKGSSTSGTGNSTSNYQQSRPANYHHGRASQGRSPHVGRGSNASGSATNVADMSITGTRSPSNASLLPEIHQQNFSHGNFGSGSSPQNQHTPTNSNVQHVLSLQQQAAMHVKSAAQQLVENLNANLKKSERSERKKNTSGNGMKQMSMKSERNQNGNLISREARDPGNPFGADFSNQSSSWEVSDQGAGGNGFSDSDGVSSDFSDVSLGSLLSKDSDEVDGKIRTKLMGVG